MSFHRISRIQRDSIDGCIGESSTDVPDYCLLNRPISQVPTGVWRYQSN